MSDANPAGTPETTVDVTELLKTRTPLKLVTGTQTTQGLTFDLQPGAIIAHPNAAVIFVCG